MTIYFELSIVAREIMSDILTWWSSKTIVVNLTHGHRHASSWKQGFSVVRQNRPKSFKFRINFDCIPFDTQTAFPLTTLHMPSLPQNFKLHGLVRVAINQNKKIYYKENHLVIKD
jgi:hypothetical protein